MCANYVKKFMADDPVEEKKKGAVVSTELLDRPEATVLDVGLGIGSDGSDVADGKGKKKKRLGVPGLGL